jgi:peptidase M28-like protein
MRFLVLASFLAILHAQTVSMLRSHVEFLASDDMKGRPCPSATCDIAADYIRSQFVGAGLEAQFQTTKEIFEIKRGDATVTPAELKLNPQSLIFDSPVRIDEQDKITSRSGRISIDRTPELEPIYNAKGTVRITNVPAGLRNVIGMVKGSDPILKDTYVLVTAHYDHIGVKAQGEGDTIFNGANDDASGISALIEIARAIARSPNRPLRSIAFIAFFGEERGLVGSRYYARNPVFPIDKTYAQLNLEQLGRTDDSEGARVKAATLTGWDRSDVGRILAAAAAPYGIRIYKHPKFSEEFFERSDNEALAKLKVPAHTLSVAYEFPDYHGVGDEAEKLDYANLTTVTRALRAGVLRLSNRRIKLTLREVSPTASAPESGNSQATPKAKQSKPSPKSPPH